MKKELDKATRLRMVKRKIHIANVNLKKMRRFIKKSGHCTYSRVDIKREKEYIKRLKKELTTIRRKYKK